MNASGYIRKFRKVQMHPVWTQLSPAVYKLMDYCIMEANWKPERWYTGDGEIVLPIGQFVTSYRELADGCHLTARQVRDAVADLERLQVIRTERIKAPGRAHEKTLITVCNYRRYQPKEDDPGQATGQANDTPRDKRTTRERHANDSEVVENGHKSNQINEAWDSFEPPLKEEEFKTGRIEEKARLIFDQEPGAREYLAAHPAKVNQESGLRMYLSSITTAEEHCRLMDGLARHMNCAKWRLPDGSLNMPQIENWYNPERFIFKKTYMDHPAKWQPATPKDKKQALYDEALRMMKEGRA